jgi:hypothetical protein
MIHIILILLAIAAFYVLTPNILIKLPIKNPVHVALIHAALFAFIWQLVYPIIAGYFNIKEGKRGKKGKGGSSKKKPPKSPAKRAMAKARAEKNDLTSLKFVADKFKWYARGGYDKVKAAGSLVSRRIEDSMYNGKIGKYGITPIRWSNIMKDLTPLKQQLEDRMRKGKVNSELRGYYNTLCNIKSLKSRTFCNTPPPKKRPNRPLSACPTVKKSKKAQTKDLLNSHIKRFARLLDAETKFKDLTTLNSINPDFNFSLKFGEAKSKLEAMVKEINDVNKKFPGDLRKKLQEYISNIELIWIPQLNASLQSNPDPPKISTPIRIRRPITRTDIRNTVMFMLNGRKKTGNVEIIGLKTLFRRIIPRVKQETQLKPNTPALVEVAKVENKLDSTKTKCAASISVLEKEQNMAMEKAKAIANLEKAKVAFDAANKAASALDSNGKPNIDPKSLVKCDNISVVLNNSCNTDINIRCAAMNNFINFQGPAELGTLTVEKNSLSIRVNDLTKDNNSTKEIMGKLDTLLKYDKVNPDKKILDANDTAYVQTYLNKDGPARIKKNDEEIKKSNERIKYIEETDIKSYNEKSQKASEYYNKNCNPIKS